MNMSTQSIETHLRSRGKTMEKIDLLGARVWITTMPGFFGEPEGAEVVVRAEDASPVDWIDERLIPDSEIA